ncbi:MAG: hemolysin family protein [candidate division KSB1 bacterium]|nr:hemolysin family protein [candidate division KSB1 bacterium]
MEYWSKLALFVCLVGLSAFFSGSETALFSLSELQKRRLEEKGTAGARRVLELLRKPRLLLTTILVCNTLVNVSAATIAALLSAQLAAVYGLSRFWTVAAQVGAVTLILLVFSEVTPKILAAHRNERFALIAAAGLRPIVWALRPITRPIEALPRWFERVLGVSEGEVSLTSAELRALVDVGEEEGALEEDEKEMIHSIFEFGKTHVREIMVPRIDMVCVERSASVLELVELIKSCGHTRIPVYEGTVDNIIGVIHAKDLLPYLGKDEVQVDLAQLARPPMFVPESKLIDELLREFQRERSHMAIVVDEYGGTAGLVTLEDVIEEIVGEIQDEYDREVPLYQRLEDGSFLMAAKMDLDEVNEVLGTQLPTDEDYESLGGLILHLTGEVPEEGDQVLYGGLEFTVEKVQKNRIVTVRVRRREAGESSGPES